MLNSIQLFGMVLLGGLAAGELARRVAALPRTTGYVLFGLLTGQSGLGWIDPLHIESAQLFIDLALGLILFELGYLVPRTPLQVGLKRLATGTLVALSTGLGVLLLLLYWGFTAGDALFAAALLLATSPAITIATCSDVGARGEKSGLLYTLVAINGCIAFAAIALMTPFLDQTIQASPLLRLAEALGSIAGSLGIGVGGAALVLLGARRLEKQPEHQHLLILGGIVFGVGTAIYLDTSVFLPMLIFGFLVRALDREQKVVAIRIASDARVFLVITFVLAGAALDIAYLRDYWLEALGIALCRFLAQWLPCSAAARQIGLTQREALFMGIGLQPMSSVALVLLANTQMLYAGLDPQLTGILLAAILLMQLFGPLTTQTAIKGFGEASRLMPPPTATAPQGGTPS
ncbi:hypothetical protein AT959_02905 [Dechloromonas denitrificans]|uniref:Cation/H+ exchanger transmembrane domain-containing protein n=1 Tax=Dechloromonas denitrificans TaxID=281362 RepID=A0A133XM54_9RHOO|nr:cation:proton antiporter [Dechloromonas denitrificans]KXB32029.1 hypothetical protein AT959_02905 [Dechloromonas denitrificans]